jgi:hypothetical protein
MQTTIRRTVCAPRIRRQSSDGTIAVAAALRRVHLRPPTLPDRPRWARHRQPRSARQRPGDGRSARDGSLLRELVAGMSPKTLRERAEHILCEIDRCAPREPGEDDS